MVLCTVPMAAWYFSYLLVCMCPRLVCVMYVSVCLAPFDFTPPTPPPEPPLGTLQSLGIGVHNNSYHSRQTPIDLPPGLLVSTLPPVWCICYTFPSPNHSHLLDYHPRGIDTQSMGSSLQRKPNQQNITPGAAEDYDSSYTDGSSFKAIRPLTFPVARGSCLGNPLDKGGQPCLPGQTEYEATQVQRLVPDSTEAGMLGHPVLISGCRDLHAGHGGHGSSINNVACVYEEIEFPICWEPHRTQTAEVSSAEASTGMGDHSVEPLELYYHRMLGADDQMQCHEPEEISESDDDEGVLVKSPNTTPKLEVGGAADALSQGQYEGQIYPKPAPQHIPQIHVQAVTPPDSKLALHVTQDVITTGRPSPAPAPIASQQKPSPIALITSNRLPQNVGLATPEYTLVNQFNNPSPTSILPRFIYREASEEERGFTPKLESFTNWPGNPSLLSFTEKAKNRAQQKVSGTYACHLRINTSPDPGISDSFLHALIPTPVPLGRELTNPDSATIKNTDYPVAEVGPATRDLHATTMVVCGFDCPLDNYIHEHFTKVALRRRWELSQSYTQWPKLKTSNRDGPVLPFNEMEDNCGIFLRQRQALG